MPGAPYILQAISATAIADEWLCHFQFCRWVKKAELIINVNVFDGNDFHFAGIKKYIRTAAMVGVL